MEHDEHPQQIEQVGGTLAAYWDTQYFAEASGRPEPDAPVEEITLQWLDGSVTTIQLRQPPGWRKGMHVDCQANRFYVAIQMLLHDMFNGEKGAQIEVETYEDGTEFIVSDATERGTSQD